MTDINNRYPDFKDMMREVRRGTAAGVLDVIDYDLAEVMNNAVPVGLDINSQVVLPEDYDPLHGPAVLMLQADDEEFRYGDAFVQVADTADLDAACIEPTCGDYRVKDVNDSFGYLVVEDVGYESDDGISMASVLPIVLVLDMRNSSPQVLFDVMAHETDHFDMLRGYSLPAADYKPFELNCNLEKRGHGVNFDINYNRPGGLSMGRSVMKIVERTARLPYNLALQQLDYEVGNLPKNTGWAILLKAVDRLYGDGTIQTTPEEQSIYSGLEVIY